MDLKKHYKDFTDALVHAFNEGELKMLVKFRLNEGLNNIVGGGPLNTRVFDLIEWADSEGKVDDLFAAALEKKPGNPKLKALAATLAEETAALQKPIGDKAEALANKEYENPKADEMRAAFDTFQTNGALQALVVDAPHLNSGQDIDMWSKRLAENRRSICLIVQGQQPIGTGFLIGDDRIMTNAHVIPAGSAGEFFAVFDYAGPVDWKTLPKLQLVEELTRSKEREYDYIIFRLKEAATGRKALSAKCHQFKDFREPVSVLGHPNGDPLTFAYGVVFDSNSFLGRVAYTANTAPGSSGSPVFSENWDLVALHHHGEKNVNNHGIPMQHILKHLAETGKAGLLNKAG